MTREEIEQLDNTEPYSFETDKEECWYKIGLKEGLETADRHPRKGLWDAEKVCSFIEENIDNYLYINRDWNAPQIKSNFIEDLRKAMED